MTRLLSITLLVISLISHSSAQIEPASEPQIASDGIALDDAGNIFITGWTTGELSGKNLGNADIFLAKYDADGNQLWIKQFGTEAEDIAAGLVIDKGGAVFIVGSTGGNLGREPVFSTEVFVGKFDIHGDQVWIKQFGLNEKSYGKDLALDAEGNVLVTGYSQYPVEEASETWIVWDQAFLTKFDSDGRQLWLRELNENDYRIARSVALDTDGNIFVAGSNDKEGIIRSPIGINAIVSKYDADGHPIWTSELGGLMFDNGFGLALDLEGNAYMIGETSNRLVADKNYGAVRGIDAYLVKYNRSGQEQWIRQFDNRWYDRVYRGSAAAVNSLGQVVITGLGKGKFKGQRLEGYDVFVMTYDADGQRLWAQYISTKTWNEGRAVAIDASDNVLITGYLDARFQKGQLKKAGMSAFLAKYTSEGQRVWFKTLTNKVASQ